MSKLSSAGRRYLEDKICMFLLFFVGSMLASIVSVVYIASVASIVSLVSGVPVLR